LAGAKMMQGPMYKNFFTFNSVLVEIIFLIWLLLTLRTKAFVYEPGIVHLYLIQN
jgi:hypothetical protein